MKIRIPACLGYGKDIGNSIWKVYVNWSDLQMQIWSVEVVAALAGCTVCGW